MLKKVVGLGPQRYSVVLNEGPNFYRKLKLIMDFLPHERMFLNPTISPLEGPFSYKPWLSKGHALCSQPRITFDGCHVSFVN